MPISNFQAYQDMPRRFGEAGAATSNPLMERQVSRARGAFERPQVAQGARGALDFAAGITMPIPIIGDVLGFSSDVARMRAEPEERTALNMGLAALGLLPFVPQGSGRLIAKAESASGSKGMEPDEFITRIKPPHEVRDKDKLKKLSESMKTDGWQGRPILAFVEPNGTIQAVTGSHRIAAAKRTKTPIPVVYINPDALKWEDPRGSLGPWNQVVDDGDDGRVEMFLRKAGEERAARLMRKEMAPE